jgi:hypothetical protein
MGMLSEARMNSAETNRSYWLRAAVALEPLETGNLAVVGECGHRLAVIYAGGWEERSWRQRIAEGRRHRKRCVWCPLR